MSLGESIRDAGRSAAMSVLAGLDRWPLRSMALSAARSMAESTARSAARVLDSRHAVRLRSGRRRYTELPGRLRAGSSIVVVGSPSGGRYTVAAMVALALARFHGPNVLAVDVGEDGGLYRRLATRAGGSADPVLAGLGIRGAGPGGSKRPTTGQWWLRQHLALTDDVLLLARDPASGEPAIRAEEYLAAVPVLGRYACAVVTDAPRLSEDSIAATVVGTADRVILVGPDDDAGHAWLKACVPWVESILRRPAATAVVAALVPTPASSPDDRHMGAGDLGVVSLRLPDDPVLHGSRPLRWERLAPRTRRAVLSLVAAVVRGLEADGGKAQPSS